MLVSGGPELSKSLMEIRCLGSYPRERSPSDDRGFMGVSLIGVPGEEWLANVNIREAFGKKLGRLSNMNGCLADGQGISGHGVPNNMAYFKNYHTAIPPLIKMCCSFTRCQGQYDFLCVDSSSHNMNERYELLAHFTVQELGHREVE